MLVFASNQLLWIHKSETAVVAGIISPLKRELTFDETSDSNSKASKTSKSVLNTVRLNVQNALTEMNVLFDVLQLAKDRKCLSSDLCHANVSVNSSQNNQPVNPQHSSSFLSVAKRTSFANSISLLSKFSNQLKSRQSLSSKSDGEFYGQLVELRKFWKIRKTQHTLLGDLYVQSSNFHHSSVFEVVKRDGALDVVLPKDLESFDYELHASFVEKSDIDSLLKFRKAISFQESVNSRVKHDENKIVHTKLKSAQKSFLNKEIFSQMCKEATHMKLACQCTVLDDRIICRLTEREDMIISLVRQRKNVSTKTESLIQDSASDNTKKSQRFEAFEISLILFIKQLYLTYLAKSSTPSISHPISAAVTSNQQFLNAAALGYKKPQFELIKKTKGILESAVDYALHLSVKFRINEYIEKLQKMYPAISFVRKFYATRKSLALKLESCLTLSMNVKNAKYAKAAKLANITISEQKIRFSCNDSWGYDTSFSCLQNMMLENVSELLVSIFLQCGASFTWRQLTYSGNAFSSEYGIILQHPDSFSKLSLRVVNNKHLQVKYWKPRKVPLVPEDNDVIQDSALHELTGDWMQVKFDRIPGKDIYEKFEHLFATFL